MLPFIMFGSTSISGHGNFSIPVNGIYVLKDIYKNAGFVLRSKYLKGGKIEDDCSEIVSLTGPPPKYVNFGSLRSPAPHSNSVFLAVLYWFVCL